jgi:hypothetical protein
MSHTLERSSPLPVGDTLHYGNWLALQMRYVTDAEALAAILPSAFVPAREPIVSISCMAATQVEFMAGRGYNILAVNLAAEFHGRKDHLVGSYAAALWENDAIPIIIGREMLGTPALYADIPEPHHDRYEWSFQCSLFGNKMIEVVISDPSPVAPEALQAIEQELNANTWMGWKSIPKADRSGADVSYATSIPIRYHLRQGWVGRGRHTFHATRWEDVLMSHPAMEALRTLRVVEYCDAHVGIGSSDLLLTNSRRLE